MNWTQILLFFITFFLGLIGYFLRDLKGSMQSQMAENKDKIDKVEKELNDLKKDLPFVYVLREDFLRAMSSVERKLDKIYDTVRERGDNSGGRD